MQPTNTLQIDPQVKNLVTAIGRAETGTEGGQTAYTRRGASGEFGRYQYTPDTWKAYATEAGVTSPLEQASIEDQNKVTYNKIKQWKDQGYNPAQIASMWNAGQGRPNAYKEGWRGVNEYGVAYDTPAYVEKVSREYTNLKNQAVLTAQPQAPIIGQQSTEEPNKSTGVFRGAKEFVPGLVSDLGKRLNQASGALSADQGFGSKALQTVGAGAGAIGDVFNRTVNLVPGVPQTLDAVGAGIGKGLETEIGQDLVQSVTKFAEEHPEAAKNIMATGNIVSVIPILKATGAGANAARKTFGGAFGKNVEKGVTEEIIAKLGTSQQAKRLIRNGIPEEMLQKGYLPDVVTNDLGRTVYTSSKAIKSVDSELSILKKAQDSHLAPQDIPLTKSQLGQYIKAGDETVIAAPVSEAIEQLAKHYASINDYAKARQIARLGEKLDVEGLSVKELNDLARLHGTDLKGFNLNGELASGLGRQAAENTRKGLKDIIGNLDESGLSRDIDAEISRLLGVRKALEVMNNKPVVSTASGKAINTAAQDALSVGGELAGNLVGIPYSGSLLSRTAGTLMRGSPMTPLQKLTDNTALTPDVKRALLNTVAAKSLHSQAPEN